MSMKNFFSRQSFLILLLGGSALFAPSEMRAAESDEGRAFPAAAAAAAGPCPEEREMDFAGFCKRRWGKVPAAELVTEILVMPNAHINRIEGALRVAQPTPYGAGVLQELERRPRPNPFPAPQSEDKETADVVTEATSAELGTLIGQLSAFDQSSPHALQQATDTVEAIQKLRKDFKSQGNQALRKSAVGTSASSPDVKRLLTENVTVEEMFPVVAHRMQQKLENVSATAAAAAAKGSPEWSCSACTFENKGDAAKCDVCASPRPPAGAAALAFEEEPHAVSSKEEEAAESATITAARKIETLLVEVLTGVKKEQDVLVPIQQIVDAFKAGPHAKLGQAYLSKLYYVPPSSAKNSAIMDTRALLMGKLTPEQMLVRQPAPALQYAESDDEQKHYDERPPAQNLDYFGRQVADLLDSIPPKLPLERAQLLTALAKIQSELTPSVQTELETFHARDSFEQAIVAFFKNQKSAEDLVAQFPPKAAAPLVDKEEAASPPPLSPALEMERAQAVVGKTAEQINTLLNAYARTPQESRDSSALAAELDKMRAALTPADLKALPTFKSPHYTHQEKNILLFLGGRVNAVAIMVASIPLSPQAAASAAAVPSPSPSPAPVAAAPVPLPATSSVDKEAFISSFRNQDEGEDALALLPRVRRALSAAASNPGSNWEATLSGVRDRARLSYDVIQGVQELPNTSVLGAQLGLLMGASNRSDSQGVEKKVDGVETAVKELQANRTDEAVFTKQLEAVQKSRGANADRWAQMLYYSGLYDGRPEKKRALQLLIARSDDLKALVAALPKS